MKSGRKHRPSDDEVIDATAAAWLAQRDDVFTAAQEREFARWRAEDVRHEVAVARLEDTWRTMQQLRAFRAESRVHPDKNLLRGNMPRGVLRFPGQWRVAALAASLAVVSLWWWTARGPEESSVLRLRTYATTVDGYQRVVLEDGSVVELNSNSEIGVRFTLFDRRVQLLQGEAHFTVAKNAARPFSVFAGQVAVRAVGTAFNVRLSTSDVEVLVTQGRVSVAAMETTGQAGDAQFEKSDSGVRRAAPKSAARDPGLAIPHPSAPSASGAGERAETKLGTASMTVAPAELGAYERIVIPAVQMGDARAALAKSVVERISPPAIREALAWQGGRLVFLDTPLIDAIAQFNRRNSMQLELADAELGAQPIGGSFRAENVDAFVRLLVSGGDVVADQPEESRIVLRKKK